MLLPKPPKRLWVCRVAELKSDHWQEAERSQSEFRRVVCKEPKAEGKCPGCPGPVLYRRVDKGE